MNVRTVSRTQDEIEFDRDALSGEVRCVNVSPFAARFEIATVAGSNSRKYTLQPGQTVMLQRGYTQPFIGASRKEVQPTIESLTERESWPGVRGTDADGKIVWKVKPGPRLPMVVAENRADEAHARWDAAMADKDAAAVAPLRMTLQRTDGSSIEVEAAIEPVPLRGKARPVIEDDEYQCGGPLDEPPPDHDDPDPVTLPAATPAAPAPTQAIPTRGALNPDGKGKAK